MPQPVIAFCTTCKDRVQHIERTLPQNLLDNASYPNAKFILVDYNSPDHLRHFVYDNHRADIESGRLVVYSFTEPGPFRMAHAKNLAHRLGIIEGADILVNLDADNFTGTGFADYIAAKCASSDAFLWANRNQPEPIRYPKGCNGRIAVSRGMFLKAGGYDEKYATWGPDDKDFNHRLRELGGVGYEIERQYLEVILHSDKMRFKDYREAEELSSDYPKEAFNRPANAIANLGKFGMGWVFRNFDLSTAFYLGPLPTRIFGIGMHKTGTTSLHTALGILGYDSAHWNDAHWAKRIWMEMTAEGRSTTLERSYALCDLPIPLLYEELDTAYPGSKFILTTRKEETWIESVRRHWSFESNPFRNQWDADPFTHRAHKLLYGQRGFNAELFLPRFRQHNAEVLEYFRGRPGDLLVMDMDSGAGWQQLCGFLKQAIPSVPYPRALKTER